MDGDVPERSLPDAKWAVGSGYPESKWVAEQVLNNAATENPAFRPVIVRIGQLTGAENGFWSPSEWVPSVIRSAPALQCLPDAPGVSHSLPPLFFFLVHLAMRLTREPFFSPACFVDPCTLWWRGFRQAALEPVPLRAPSPSPLAHLDRTVQTHVKRIKGALGALQHVAGSSRKIGSNFQY